MPIDWKTLESYQRLLAAVCASNDNNIDYKKVAYFFGQGATYDSIEGRFRIAKRKAKELMDEAEKEGRQMPATRPKSATSTPRKPKAARPSADASQHSVQSGRVTKATASTPSKKRTVKREPPTPQSIEDDAEPDISPDTDTLLDPNHSFNNMSIYSLESQSFWDDHIEDAV